MRGDLYIIIPVLHWELLTPWHRCGATPKLDFPDTRNINGMSLGGLRKRINSDDTADRRLNT